jgi:hypothetical protein
VFDVYKDVWLGPDGVNVFVGRAFEAGVVAVETPTTWESQFTEAPIREVTGSDFDDLYMLGKSSVSHWDGQTLSVIEDGLDADDRDWNAITSVGDTIYVAGQGEIVERRDGTWAKALVVGLQGFRDIEVLPDGSVVAASRSLFFGHNLFQRDTLGQWSRIPRSEDPVDVHSGFEWVRAVTVVGETAYAVGLDGRVASRHMSADSWTAETELLAGPLLDVTGWLDPNTGATNVVAVGNGGPALVKDPSGWWASDPGIAYDVLKTPRVRGAGGRALALDGGRSAKQFLGGGWSSPLPIRRTAAGPADGVLRGTPKAAIFDDGGGWVLGAGGAAPLSCEAGCRIGRLSDDGIVLEDVSGAVADPAPGQVNCGALWDLAAVGPDSVFVVGSLHVRQPDCAQSASASTRSLVLHYNGAGWADVSPPSLEILRSAVPYDGGVAVLSATRLFRCDATSCSEIAELPTALDWLFRAVAVWDDTVYLMGGHKGTGVVYRYFDGQWSTSLTGFDAILAGLAVGEDDIYAGTAAGELLHFNGSTWTQIDYFKEGSISVLEWSRYGHGLYVVGFGAGQFLRHGSPGAWGAVELSGSFLPSRITPTDDGFAIGMQPGQVQRFRFRGP